MSFQDRSEIAQRLTGRCNNCYERLPGAIGCSVHSPGWNWATPNFGPFCDDCWAELGGVQDLLKQAAPLLRTVRVLDCGAHYCRYCPAKSPLWEHSPSCLYVESQKEQSDAHALAAEIAKLLPEEG